MHSNDNIVGASSTHCVGLVGRGFGGRPPWTSNSEIVIRHVQGSCDLNEACREFHVACD